MWQAPNESGVCYRSSASQNYRPILEAASKARWSTQTFTSMCSHSAFSGTNGSRMLVTPLIPALKASLLVNLSFGDTKQDSLNEECPCFCCPTCRWDEDYHSATVARHVCHPPQTAWGLPWRKHLRQTTSHSPYRTRPLSPHQLARRKCLWWSRLWYELSLPLLHPPTILHSHDEPQDCAVAEQKERCKDCLAVAVCQEGRKTSESKAQSAGEACYAHDRRRSSLTMNWGLLERQSKLQPQLTLYIRFSKKVDPDWQKMMLTLF